MSIDRAALLARLGVQPRNPGACAGFDDWRGGGPQLAVVNPADATVLAEVAAADSTDYEAVLQSAAAAARAWRDAPAPARGEAVRRFGMLLREHKDALGTLVSLENGKIKAEGDGEVQEMIDIADFAVGQSRMLYGKTMHSERPGHRMYEQWHPLGVVGRRHRVQLSGCRLGMERDARSSLRQRNDMETFAENAADGDRGAEAVQPGHARR